MKSDITSRNDIKLIIDLFYEKLMNHKAIAHFFDDFKDPQKLKIHLKIIVDFWEDILFHTSKYTNNPIQKHLDVAKKMPFSEKEFTIWIFFFKETIDQLYKGDIADSMKNRAESIATVMKVKLNLY